MKMRWLLVPAPLFVSALLFASCGGDGDDGEPEVQPTPAASVVQIPPSEETPPTDEATPTAEATPAAREVISDPGEVGFALAFGGFDRPVDLDPIPGRDGFYLAAEQVGRILLLNEADPGSTAIAGDLSDRVSRADNEEGLLGLAFSPDFEESADVYLYYSASGGSRRTVLSRFSFDGETLDPSSQQILYQVDQPHPNHKGGALQFGQDGMLYLGLGDGGSQADPDNNGQDLTTALGSVLRFDVSGEGAVAPDDNPFVGSDTGALEEIYAYGVRNPWRFSFDRETGDLWLGDVGGSSWEEVNIVSAGGNYGWNRTEGPDCHEPPEGCDRSGLIDPVVSYGHDQGCSITGGYVYRGADLPSLYGWYVYADFCSGRVWATSSADTTSTVVLRGEGPPIASFAESADGEMFALSFDGNIYRLSAP